MIFIAEGLPAVRLAGKLKNLEASQRVGYDITSWQKSRQL